jgi:hypothetical protein
MGLPSVSRLLAARHLKLPERLGQGSGQRYPLVQPGEVEQPPRLTAGTDHVQAGAVRGGPGGHARQRAEPGGVDERHPVQVGHERAAAGRHDPQPLAQLGHGGDVHLAFDLDQHVSRLAAHPDT